MHPGKVVALQKSKPLSFKQYESNKTLAISSEICYIWLSIKSCLVIITIIATTLLLQTFRHAYIKDLVVKLVLALALNL